MQSWLMITDPWPIQETWVLQWHVPLLHLAKECHHEDLYCSLLIPLITILLPPCYSFTTSLVPDDITLLLCSVKHDHYLFWGKLLAWSLFYSIILYPSTTSKVRWFKFVVVTWQYLNASNAEATIIQSTRAQRFLKNVETMSCWYSLDSSCWVLSDEYLYVPGFQSFFRFFA